MSYTPPFPIVPQPSIPMDPLQAQRLRTQALLKMQQTANAAGKGNFNNLSDEDLSMSPAGRQEVAGIVNGPAPQEGFGPRAGLMPPLADPQDVSEPPGGVSVEPANASEEPEGGPTDIRPQPDSTAATPVAAAADPLEKELGGDPESKPSGTFWDNPASSEALIAFGAAMLRGKNFNEGLANGAEAVTKALEPYKMPSRAEVARATMAARLKRYASGADGTGKSLGYSSPAFAYDPSGNMFQGGFNKDTGKYEWRDLNGNVMDKLPDGTKIRSDTGEAELAKLNQRNLEEAVNVGADVATQIGDIESMQHDFVNSGVGGAGIVNRGLAWAQELTGKDIVGDLGSQQTFELVKSRLELALGQTQRGLGQLTEGERLIIRQSLPSLNQDPRAFYRITEMMKMKALRSQAIVEAYQNLPDAERNKYRLGIKQYAMKWDKENKYAEKLRALRTADLPDWMKQGPGKAKVPSASTPAAPGSADDPDSKYY